MVCEHLVCRTSLEEELDMQRVQAAMDRATVKELHLCLTEEHKGKKESLLNWKSEIPPVTGDVKKEDTFELFLLPLGRVHLWGELITWLPVDLTRQFN